MKKIVIAFVLPVVLFTAIILSMSSLILLDAFVLDRELAADTTVNRRPPVTEPMTSTSGTLPDGPLPPVSDSLGSETPGDDPDEPIEPDGPLDTETPPIIEVPTPDYPILTENSYQDENIKITIEERYVENQNGIRNRVFVVDLKLSSIEYLRTFINFEGKKVVKTTVSAMAEKNDAIFAINGDFFTMRDYGFVLRNYVIYREWARAANDKFSDDALLFLSDGTMMIVDESEVYYNGVPSANGLPLDTYQCFAFGPRLVEAGDITVSENDEVGQAAAANPRTAIGMIEPLHYKIVVAEGRLERYHKLDGMTLYELATFMKSLGCGIAYNLDGGSSSTIYFNGEVLNETPDDERRISDCIYINGKSFSEEVDE